MTGQAPSVRFAVRPLTAAHWDDMAGLFGRSGGSSGCWCLWWRLTRAQWQAMGRGARRQAFQAIVEAGAVPGVLAYDGRDAVGWCSVGPRRWFPSMDRSAICKPTGDEDDAWTINCFYVAPRHRGRSVTRALIGGAVAHARQAGAGVIEAFPHDIAAERAASGSVFTGLAGTFAACGFREVERRSPARPAMRLDLAPAKRRGRRA